MRAPASGQWGAGERSAGWGGRAVGGSRPRAWGSLGRQSLRSCERGSCAARASARTTYITHSTAWPVSGAQLHTRVDIGVEGSRCCEASVCTCATAGPHELGPSRSGRATGAGSHGGGGGCCGRGVVGVVVVGSRSSCGPGPIRREPGMRSEPRMCASACGRWRCSGRASRTSER